VRWKTTTHEKFGKDMEQELVEDGTGHVQGSCSEGVRQDAKCPCSKE
jgi:hypothetical protein